jgi:putative IMPACT (imprinted ancient) family translation regulator
LGQIKSFDLTNVLVAVVRYFGGTKLGIGGLTAAYKNAANDALKNAIVIEDILRETLVLETGFMHLPELMNFVKQNNVRILEQKMFDCCIIKISVPMQNLDILKSALLQMQNITVS